MHAIHKAIAIDLFILITCSKPCLLVESGVSFNDGVGARQKQGQASTPERRHREVKLIKNQNIKLRISYLNG